MPKHIDIDVYGDCHPPVVTTPRFNTNYDRVSPPTPEGSLEPSMTIPDQSLTVKEILARFASGKPVPVQDVSYTGDVYFPDVATLDLVEREALWATANSRIATLEDQLKAEGVAAQQRRDHDDLIKWRELSERIKGMEIPDIG